MKDDISAITIMKDDISAIQAKKSSYSSKMVYAGNINIRKNKTYINEYKQMDNIQRLCSSKLWMVEQHSKKNGKQ